MSTERRSRFVRPEVRVLKISDGDSITVRKRLNRGEEAAMFARLYMHTEGGLRVNHLQAGIAMVVAYLVDWTLTDEDGARVPIRDLDPDSLTTVVNNLDPADFTEIKLAIEKHEQEMLAERQLGKQSDGGQTSPETLPSHDAVVGDTRTY